MVRQLFPDYDHVHDLDADDPASTASPAGSPGPRPLSSPAPASASRSSRPAPGTTDHRRHDQAIPDRLRPQSSTTSAPGGRFVVGAASGGGGRISRGRFRGTRSGPDRLSGTALAPPMGRRAMSGRYGWSWPFFPARFPAGLTRAARAVPARTSRRGPTRKAGRSGSSRGMAPSGPRISARRRRGRTEPGLTSRSTTRSIQNLRRLPAADRAGTARAAPRRTIRACGLCAAVRGGGCYCSAVPDARLMDSW